MERDHELKKHHFVYQKRDPRILVFYHVNNGHYNSMGNITQTIYLTISYFYVKTSDGVLLNPVGWKVP
jgi:hypothetical protein